MMKPAAHRLTLYKLSVPMGSRFGVACLLALSFSACSVIDKPSSNNSATSYAANDLEMKPSYIDDQSGTDINQIGTTDGQLSATQIPANVQSDRLTVDQLKVYADRCQPDSQLAPPPGFDCSELRLRMQRVFRSEDKVTEALITLDRLGRSDNSQSVERDLKDGNPYASLNAQAVASGVLDTAPPPEEIPSESFNDFLLENGLALDAGTIIANTGQ